jgi:hypothetical protein
MQGYLWIIWVKLAGVLWIIGGKIRQLINILFCGYRRSENHAETYTRLGTVPQRVISYATVINDHDECQMLYVHTPTDKYLYHLI